MKIQLDPESLNTVKRIIFESLPGVPVYCFGSRVKGTAKKYSDLDLLIRDKAKIPLDVMAKLDGQFDESDLPITIDLIDWHRITPEFRAAIQDDCVLLYTQTS